MATKVIEHVNAHYEVQDVEMGKVYRWCPESVVVECACGKKLTLTASKSLCEKLNPAPIGGPLG